MNKKRRDKLIKIVGCNPLQLEKIKSTLFDFQELIQSEKEIPHAYYRFRIVVKNTIRLLSLTIVLYFLFDINQYLYFNMLSVPFSIFFLYWKIKKTFFKISENSLSAGSGSIETHVTYLELYKIQNVKIIQPIFQKKRGIMAIVLQMASGKIKIPCIQKERALEIYNYIVYKVEISTKNGYKKFYKSSTFTYPAIICFRNYCWEFFRLK